MSGFKPYDASSSGGGGGGGGGLFYAQERQAQLLAAGQTGTLLTVTAPTGKVLRITGAICNGSGSQSGLSLIVDGNTLLDGKALHGNGLSIGSVDFFAIANSYGNGDAQTCFSILQPILCNSFVFSKNTGNTTRSIFFSYEIGEVK